MNDDDDKFLLVVCDNEANKEFVCPQCSKTFCSKYNVDRHEITFHGKKRSIKVQPHECQVCSKKFKQKSHLYRHTRDFHSPILDHLTVPVKQKKKNTEKGATLETKKRKLQRSEIIPCLDAYLPEGDYNIIFYEEKPNGFRLQISFSCTTVSEGLEFVQHHQAVAKVRYRLKYTLKNKHNFLLKNKYACHHKSQKKSEKNKKNLNCPATLLLKIVEIEDTTELKCYVTMAFTHNHSTDNAAALVLLKPSPDIIEKFKRMFEAGFTPSKALRRLEEELHKEHGDEYYKVLTDRSICPDSMWVYHYYYNMIKKNNEERDGRDALIAVENTKPEWNDSLQTYTCTSLETSPVSCSKNETDIEKRIRPGSTELKKVAEKKEKEELRKLMLDFEKATGEMVKRVTNNAKEFETGAVAFIKQYRTIGNNASLLSALHSFGKLQGRK